MKKLFLLVAILFILTGCASVQSSSIEEILNSSMNSLVDVVNVNRKGYSYYLPRGLSIKSSHDYNEIISDQKYLYYLYVDIVSYNSEVTFSYNINDEAYYSASLSNNGEKGYIEINNYENDQYLIEIMYNYAKIEVIVDKYDLPKAISNSLIILSSVKYNSEILETIVGENILTSKEIEFNIFETKKTESNFLEVEANNIYVEEENDPDLIN